MKTEVTMLPNTSRATMPPAAHPANDAEPRIAPASVRLRRLHARTLAKGFTLYMVKAVMNGRGDELVDLAVSNLWL
jgi:hypothetical protein